VQQVNRCGRSNWRSRHSRADGCDRPIGYRRSGSNWCNGAIGAVGATGAQGIQGLTGATGPIGATAHGGNRSNRRGRSQLALKAYKG